MTVGTTTPKVTFWIPSSSGIDDGALFVPKGAEGIRFVLGIVTAATTTIGGSSAPTNGLHVELRYT